MRFTLNGKRVDLTAPPMKRLLDVLREECAATGTKEGCGEGECGACTVLLDGEPVASCLVAVAQVEEREVVTIEGLAGHPLLDAFARAGAAQCGIGTPGMLIASADLLSKDPRPTETTVREALSGNLCRCTGYVPIVEAVYAARAAYRKGTP